MNDLEQGQYEDERFMRLHNCISYIEKERYNISGWMLFEIPVFYSHCFYNEQTQEAFDLAVWDIGEVIPRYLDSASNEQDAKTIQDAINKGYSDFMVE
ncbi:hypothetical protein ACPV3A_29580 [Paenibacillus sp. Dod16]|uniref:hypothetical protein n=1 Tax=Paenibacillus sp. Dod16 TaxID=3416392 RepID=UPI003CF928EC